MSYTTVWWRLRDLWRRDLACAIGEEGPGLHEWASVRSCVPPY